MKISSQKETKLIIIVMMSSLLAVGCIMYFGMGCPLWYVLLMIVPLFAFLVIPYSIIIGREIVMDAEGCTISFLCFRCWYKWDELVIKRIENYNRVTYKSPYNKAVIFSKSQLKKPAWMKPDEYMMVPFHTPFFFVYFFPQSKTLRSDKLNSWPLISCVDESLFISRMKEWGIDI